MAWWKRRAELTAALDDVRVLMSLIALMPYAVPVRPVHIPAPRQPVEPRPASRPAPTGTPATPSTQWGARRVRR